MKMEFSSQRREMLLFLTTNMAAVTSRANQQLIGDHTLLPIICIFSENLMTSTDIVLVIRFILI